MNWQFNGIRVYTQKISEGMKQIIAQLQPLDGGTVYQMFGYESDKLKLNALIVGDADRIALKGLRKTGLSYELLSPEGDLGDFFVSSVSFDREKSVYQTITTSGGLTCTSPVYNLELELFLDS